MGSSIRYGGNKKYKIPAYICGFYLTNNAIASIHTFGSSSIGPYYDGFQNSRHDPFIDTKPRIDHAMKLYITNLILHWIE